MPEFEMTYRDRIILALDVPNQAAAGDLISQTNVGMYKVGLQLFIREGYSFVADLTRNQIDVMLDLKLHDIPNTVAEAVRQMADLGVSFFTVHATGGPKMIEAARKVIDNGGYRMKMLAVTVLTSHDQEEWRDLIDCSLDRTVQREDIIPTAGAAERLAYKATEAGAHGVVCSPKDLSAMKSHKADGYTLRDDVFFVCPGVRFPDGDQGDQKRVMGPREAIVDGADYLVIGRPIRTAKDPQKAVERFSKAIEAGRAARAGK
jgi:orotidine-5'-phosphate decarboxylase